MSPFRTMLAGACLAAAIGLPSLAPAQQPASVAEAQARLRTADSTTTLAIHTRDGSTFFGRVIALRGDSAVVTTGAGSLTIRLTEVVRVSEIRPEDMRAGEYWFPNPNATRLLFAPTGRMLKKGKGYFSDYLIFFPGVAYGVTDRVTLGGGMSIIPGIDPSEQLFYLTPKVGLVSTPRLNVAAGVLLINVGLGDGDSETAGIAYSVATFGGEHASVTGGLGLGFADGELADSPAVMVGGDVRVSRRLGLVTENYYFAGLSDEALLSAGLRFFGEKLSVDFGLVHVTDSGTLAIPFVGFVANF